MQNDVQNTAGFAGLNHVGGEVVEDLGIELHGVGQSGAAFDRGTHAGQRLLESRVLLVGGQNFQTLHQGKTGVDHDRELPEENGDVLGLDFARAEGRHDKFFALFPDGAWRDALAPQLAGQHLFVGRSPLAADFLTGLILP